MKTTLRIGTCLAAVVTCASCSRDDAASSTGGTSGSGGSSGQRGSAGSSGGGTIGSGGSGGDAGGSDAGPIGRPCVPVPSGEPMAADPSFQPGTVDASMMTVEEVLVDRKGRIVVAGERHYAPYDIFVARYLPNGALDGEFHGVGLSMLSLPELASQRLETLAFDEQDRIWIGGTVTTNEDGSASTAALIARLTEDGYLDTSFNASGATAGVKAFRPRGEAADAGSAEASVDNIVVIGPGALIAGKPHGYFDRVLDDGAFDPAFGFRLDGFGGRAQVVADTLFLLSGSGLAAFDFDGEPRAGFGTGGVVRDLDDSFDPTAIVALEGGRLLVIDGGYGTDLMRLTSTGDIDQSFGTRGYDRAVNDCIPRDVAVACDGRILTVGVDIQSHPLPTRYCAMAFEPDGTLPASAPADGMYTWDPPEPRSSTLWARLDATGHIVIASELDGPVALERYNPPWSAP